MYLIEFVVKESPDLLSDPPDCNTYGIPKPHVPKRSGAP